MQTRQELYELLDYDPTAENGWVTVRDICSRAEAR